MAGTTENGNRPASSPSMNMRPGGYEVVGGTGWFRSAYAALVLILLAVRPLSAQSVWQDGGIQVCASTGRKSTPAVAPDGDGGAFVAWLGSRSLPRVQHLSSRGQLLWGDTAIALRTDSLYRTSPKVISDGQHGAVVLWGETRQSSSLTVAQRLDPTGHFLWNPSAVTICTGFVSSVSSVNAGSAAVLFDYNGLRAQRFDLDGNVLWDSGGARIDPPGVDDLFLYSYSVVTDGRGGAYVTWLWVAVEIRQHQPYYIDHEAICHLDSLGTKETSNWVVQEEGLGSYGSLEPVINCLPDTGGGAIVAWTAIQSASNVSYSRVWNDTLIWPGRMASSRQGNRNLQLVPDNAGGAIICFRSFASNVLLQRVGPAGPLWGSAGVVVDSSAALAVAEDDSSGAVVVCGSINYGPLKANRFRATGLRAWQVRLCPESDSVGSYSVINDHAGGAIAVWSGKRFAGWTIFAQRLNLGGLGVESEPELEPTTPCLTVLGSPGRDRIGLRWRSVGDASIALYDVSGKRVRLFQVAGARNHPQQVWWDGTDDQGCRLSPGAYIGQLRTRRGRLARAVLFLVR